jgi:hypothetical protein
MENHYREARSRVAASCGVARSEFPYPLAGLCHSTLNRPGSERFQVRYDSRIRERHCVWITQ